MFKYLVAALAFAIAPIVYADCPEHEGRRVSYVSADEDVTVEAEDVEFRGEGEATIETDADVEFRDSDRFGRSEVEYRSEGRFATEPVYEGTYTSWDMSKNKADKPSANARLNMEED